MNRGFTAYFRGFCLTHSCQQRCISFPAESQEMSFSESRLHEMSKVVCAADYMSAWGSLGGIGSRASQRRGRPPVFRRRHLGPINVFHEGVLGISAMGPLTGHRGAEPGVTPAFRAGELGRAKQGTARSGIWKPPGSLRSMVCAAPRRRRDARHRKRPQSLGASH